MTTIVLTTLRAFTINATRTGGMAYLGAAMLARASARSLRTAATSVTGSGARMTSPSTIGSLSYISVRGYADKKKPQKLSIRSSDATRKPAHSQSNNKAAEGSTEQATTQAPDPTIDLASIKRTAAGGRQKMPPPPPPQQPKASESPSAPSVSGEPRAQVDDIPSPPPGQEAKVPLDDAPSVVAVQQEAPERPRAAAFDIDTSTLIATAEEHASSKGQTGARARGSRASSEEKSRKRTGRIVGYASVGLLAYFASQLGREWDTVAEREKHGDDPASESFFGRFRLRLQDMYRSAKAPVWDKLLPDPMPHPYQRPYTLVLDVDDLLIHSEWSRQHAWRTAKRPGLDYFLGYLSQFFEIVLFSRQPMYIVAPVVEKLDPDMRMISYSLFRESCRLLDNGKVVKDLSHLNRDLSKVIAIDTDPEALCLQPENAIILKPWKGDRNDTDLIGLLSFLEAVGIYNIEDVRPTIKSYEGTHIPTEHVKRREQIRKQEEEDWKRKQGSGGSSFLGGLRGAAAKADEAPKMWYEREQDRFRQFFQEEQKFWQENGEALRQQAKDEQEKKLKEMKLSVWGFMTGAAMDQQPGSDAGGSPAQAQPASK